MDALLSIDGEVVTVAEAAGWAAVIGGPDLAGFALEQVAIARAAEARGLEATGAEIKTLFSELRYMKRLESGDALRRWMADNRLTTDTISRACAQLILRRKLRETITEADVAGYYAENRPSFERVEIYRLTVGEQELARELRAAVEEEDESFCLLAIQYSTDAATARMGGYVGEVGRADVSAEVEAAIFGAGPGDLIGPIGTEDAWSMFLVHDARTIPLDDARAGIRDLLFDEMIAEAVERTRTAALQTAAIA